MKRVLLSVLALMAPIAAHAAELTRAEKFLIVASPDTLTIVESLQEYIPNVCALSRDEFAQKTQTEIKVRTKTKSIKAKKPDELISETMAWRALHCGS